ncbi:DUF5753 domain-containing protein [Solwaraspora sp. WMMD937]|uniref:DUF5753 domain-containing protein n=1 Tax=Solwaraspora sp. WMMD937 TaxID=3016090 RepID=UPI00249AEB05|nr:DUF5753 domain-containing protein [Solwaraspora sp. WMMD937]WFE19197.1 DUF5753 domain-containing protein [Solwaraspora sp. WMMD937]
MAASILNSSVPRRRLGQEVRKLRDRQNHVSTAVAAGMLQWPASKLRRIEHGEIPVCAEDVASLCSLYGAEAPMIEALTGLATKTREKGWWHDYASLPPWFDIYSGFEEAASRLRIYEFQIVPDLLQSRAYAAAVTGATAADPPATHTAIRMATRTAGTGVLTRSTSQVPDIEVVLAESVLMRVVGSYPVMAEQLHRLTDASRLPNVSVRVLPFSAGLHPGMTVGTPFTILDFADASEPSIVHHEMLTGALFLDRQAEVDLYALTYDGIRSAALDAAESRTLLLDTAKEYEHFSA